MSSCGPAATTFVVSGHMGRGEVGRRVRSTEDDVAGAIVASECDSSALFFCDHVSDGRVEKWTRIFVCECCQVWVVEFMSFCE